MQQIVVITGATSGFGEGCARRFAKEGAKLILVGRRADRLRKLAAELKTETLCLTLDVRDAAAVEKTFGNLPPAFAEVSVLVNNAGLALGLDPAHSASLDDWNTMIDTNCKGLMYCTRALLPGMVKRNRGHVINIGSIAGTYPYPGGNVYGATKAFVKQFSLNLRADLLGTAIRVTNIEPGLAETEFSVVRFYGNEEKAKAVYKGVQPIVAEDIAEAVFWCTSLPAHININRLEIMPVAQAFAAPSVSRKPENKN